MKNALLVLFTLCSISAQATEKVKVEDFNGLPLVIHCEGETHSFRIITRSSNTKHELRVRAGSDINYQNKDIKIKSISYVGEKPFLNFKEVVLTDGKQKFSLKLLNEYEFFSEDGYYKVRSNIKKENKSIISNGYYFCGMDTGAY